MAENDVIGKVTATESNPTTCTNVRFWVSHDVIIRPFDIVQIEHLKNSRTYAIVTDLQYITDSKGHLSDFISSDFGDLQATPQNERLGTTIADAEILLNTKEIEMPIREGATVRWAEVDGIRKALGLEAFASPVPAGYFCMSNGTEVPIDLEASFLLGPEGAHLNIAGISGLATKTSYAMFLLAAIQQKMREKVTVVIFNVKGHDLLAIDQPNPDLAELSAAGWKRCGLEPIPFKDVTYLLPYSSKADQEYTSSHADRKILKKHIETGVTFNFYYDVEATRNRLPLLFSDVEDASGTMESIIHALQEEFNGSWQTVKQNVRQKTDRGNTGDKTIPIQSWRKFRRHLETRVSGNDLFTDSSAKKEKRQRSVAEAITGLKAGKALVVDLEPLPDYLQCFVFGDVIRSLYEAKLGDNEQVRPEDLGTVILFADELNKYSPKASENSQRFLTQHVLEITERGRSLGMILFGAEQFRSGVHDRVLNNCGTNVYGRTSPVEIAKGADYRFFNSAQKSALTQLPKGSLLVQHAIFKTPLVKLIFPMPCYYQPKGK